MCVCLSVCVHAGSLRDGVLQLYSEFADVFDLSECKLSIIHCADHHDPALVETLWKEIIDKRQLLT